MDQKLTEIIHSTYDMLDFFPDGDPLKTRAKEKALALLEGFVMLESAPGENEKTREQLLADMAIMEKYLELGRHQGWLGGFNFLILLKEYHSFAKELLEIKSAKTVLPVVPENIRMLKTEKTPVLSRLTVRQEKILKILAQKENAQVADFLKEIQDVTKRTLRRDLDDLLKKGKIKRVGEWNMASYVIGHNRTS